MGIRHRMIIAVATVATVLLVGAGLAWACTQQAYISVTPDEAEAGAQVTVNGEQFMPQHEISVRWGGRNGPELGRGRGPEFHMEVTVPESAEPGDYLVWAVDTEDEWAARRSFTVTDPNTADSSGASGGASGGEQTTESDTSGQTTASTSGGDGTSDDSSSGGSDQTAATTSGGSGDGRNDESSSTSSGDSQQEESMAPESGSDEPASQEGSAQEGPASDDASQPSSESSQQGEPSPPESASQEPTSQEGASQQEPQEEAVGSESPEQVGASSPPDAPEQGAAEQPGNPAGPSPEDAEAEPAAGEPTSEGDGPAASEQADGEAAARAEDGDASVSAQAPPTDPDSSGGMVDDGAAQPSTSTGSQDLWEGLDSSQGSDVASSLDGPVAEEGALAGAGQQLAMAAGLLGAGLVMLAAGAFVAVRRRYGVALAAPERSR